MEKTKITEEDLEYIEITSFLSRIEHFAVGANTSIYNVKIIKRLAGKYFINLYKKLSPIIEYKKDARPKAKHYDEFEALVKKLEKQYKREEAMKKIKEMLELQNKLTMSVSLYALLSLFGAFLLGISALICGVVSNIVNSIGCSIIAGVIVAGITDMKATKIKRETDNEKYEIQSKELKSECENLPCSICVTVCDNREDLISKQKSFKEWCNELFNLKETSEIKYCLEMIKDIQRMCTKFQIFALNNLDNGNYNLELIKKIKKLDSVCNRIVRAKQRERYKDCKGIMLNEFRENVIDLFPELKNDYTRTYDASTYDEEEV